MAACRHRAGFAQAGAYRGSVWRIVDACRTSSEWRLAKLQELGYVDGQNIDIVYKYAEGDQERAPLLADDLVRLKPDVIVVTSSMNAVLAVQQATATIPIVSTALSEVAAALGLVESRAY